MVTNGTIAELCLQGRIGRVPVSHHLLKNLGHRLCYVTCRLIGIEGRGIKEESSSRSESQTKNDKGIKEESSSRSESQTKNDKVRIIGSNVQVGLFMCLTMVLGQAGYRMSTNFK
ncbi:hypothetical protein HanPSC8_Chr07g0300011 [Helianthus annuus]|nr:hypothetical protein HanPSC8_Chr07g0300011 [Helianthus annuus]